jgi:hypothetical protein
MSAVALAGGGRKSGNPNMEWALRVTGQQFLRRRQGHGVSSHSSRPSVQVEASFDHGVLTIRVPKAALPQPKRVEIKAGASTGDGSVKSQQQLATAASKR